MISDTTECEPKRIRRHKNQNLLSLTFPFPPVERSRISPHEYLCSQAQKSLVSCQPIQAMRAITGLLSWERIFWIYWIISDPNRMQLIWIKQSKKYIWTKKVKRRLPEAQKKFCTGCVRFELTVAEKPFWTTLCSTRTLLAILLAGSLKDLTSSAKKIYWLRRNTIVPCRGVDSGATNVAPAMTHLTDHGWKNHQSGGSWRKSCKTWNWYPEWEVLQNRRTFVLHNHSVKYVTVKTPNLLHGGFTQNIHSTLVLLHMYKR